MKTMKYLKIAVASLLVMAVSFSCVKREFDEPDLQEACLVKSPISANTTIKNIKEKFAVYTAIEGSDEIKRIDDNSIIEGVVIANDKGGNIYKTIYIKDAVTGDAIAVSLDQTDVYSRYPVGQKIVINCQGLYLNSFGMITIGGSTRLDEGKVRMGGIPSAMLNTVIFIESCAKKEYAEPEVIAMKDLTDADLGKLVKIEGVQFIDANLKSTNHNYYDVNSTVGGSTNREIEDANGNKLVVRNSAYADFSNTPLPEGSGYIIAIYSAYGTSTNNKQLFVRNTDDVVMTNERLTAGGGAVDGKGTKDNPYTIADAISSNTGNALWVKGYIVGVYESVDATGASLETNVTSFAGPFNTTYNILVADKPNETNKDNVVCVQLPFGDIRDALNLKENGSKLGKELMVKGDLLKYNGFAGVKNTNGYMIDGAGIDPDAVTEGAILEEKFMSGMGAFTNFSTTGDLVWSFDSQYKCVKMSGYNSSDKKRYDNEDYIISPAIDLTGKTGVTLSFTHAVGFGNYATVWDDLKVMVSENYTGTGDPASATWTEFDFAKPSDLSKNFVWTNSGELALTNYQGKKNIYVAFKYKCTTTNCSTWELKNFLVKENK